MDKEAAYQEWSFDGINGKSVIFDSGQFPDIDDDAVLEMVRQLLKLNEEDLMTIKRTDDLIFVNFDFQTF